MIRRRGRLARREDYPRGRLFRHGTSRRPREGRWYDVLRRDLCLVLEAKIVKLVAAKILDSTHLELREAISTPAGESIEIAIPETVSDDNRQPRRARHRQVEQEWRRSHAEILRGYAGQWVVLEEQEIIAHGEDPESLVELARDQGVEVPYVFYVDPPRPGIVKIGL